MLRLAVPLALLLALTAACSSDDGENGGKNGTGGGATSSSSRASSASSSASSTAVAVSSSSAGGGGGGPFMTAAHRAPAMLASLGGPVLASPKVQPIAYAQDPFAKDFEKFVSELAGSSYWTTVSESYGVGAITALPPIELQDDIPAMSDEDTYLLPLDDNTHGDAPPWGPSDPSTIYAFLLPQGIDFEADGASCCDGYGGFHYEAVLNGGVVVPYAFICQCDFGTGVEDGTTLAASHEILEAATDPFPMSDPAYAREDTADGAFTDGSLGEAGDLCMQTKPLTIVPPGIDYAVQRMWSNDAAAKGDNPCQPDPASVYYNAAPVLSEKVTLYVDGEPINTDGVRIPVGQLKTIEVDLFSNKPYPNGWNLEVIDAEQLLGGKPTLSFGWDEPYGTNGDVRHLSIQSISTDPKWGSSVFMIIATDGSTQNFWFGAVGH